MKKLFTILMLSVTLSSFSSAVAAYEASIPVLTHADSSANAEPSGFIVQGDGTLITNPGAVFSEGSYRGNFELPYLISTTKPIAYPRWAIQQQWQGDIVLALEILTDGTVGRMQVMESTGRGLLDRAAMEAVKTWTFHPAMQDGKPVVECIQIPVRFQLSKDI